MINKLLVEVIIPNIDEKYNIYIPVNKRIGKTIILINKAIKELSNGRYIISDEAILYNRITGEKYNPELLVYKTSIVNGSSLILL